MFAQLGKFEAMETFNSLFEMHAIAADIDPRRLQICTFNSLFEMLAKNRLPYRGCCEESFNSLFEMRPRPPVQRALGFEFLSILYLRCLSAPKA